MNARKILQEFPNALDAHEYFKALRDKHIAHDQNAYQQCVAGAVLNGRASAHKIVKIICTNVLSGTLEQANWSNLFQHITEAHDWVVEDFDWRCDHLTLALEKQDYEKLFSRDSVDFHVPTVDDIGVARPKT